MAIERPDVAYLIMLWRNYKGMVVVVVVVVVAAAVAGCQARD